MIRKSLVQYLPNGEQSECAFLKSAIGEQLNDYDEDNMDNFGIACI